MKKKQGNFENKTILAWKMAIASSISWELAKMVGSLHPYLAPLSVVLCLQNTIDQSIRQSFHRILGTVMGIILTAYIVSYLDMNGWMLGILILGGTLIVKWLRFDIAVLHQAALTIVLIFTFEQKSKDYALDRIIDTIIGAIIAVFIQMLLFPPDYTKKAAASLRQLSHQLSEIFLDLANWIQYEWGQGKRHAIEYKITLFLQELHDTRDALAMASSSIKFNPFSKKHQSLLSMYQKEVNKMNKGYQYVSSIVETIKDWEKEGQLSPHDQMEAENYLKVLSEYFENPAVLQRNESRKEIHRLLDLLHSNRLLNLQPGYAVCRDSFCFETKKLLKNLTMDFKEGY